MSRARTFLTALGLGTLALGAGLILATATATKSYSADKGGVPTASPNIFADAPVAKVSWTGIYVSGGVGYGAANGALSSARGGGIDGLSATGRLGTVDLGADWQIPGSFLVLGARGGYSWSDENFTIAPGLLKAGLRDGWHGDARIGAALGTALPYLGFGLTQIHTSASGLVVPSNFSSPDLNGKRYIGGIEFRLPKLDTGSLLTPTLGLEAIYTDYDSKSFGSGRSATTLDVTDLSVLARLTLRVGRDYVPAYAPVK